MRKNTARQNGGLLLELVLALSLIGIVASTSIPSLLGSNGKKLLAADGEALERLINHAFILAGQQEVAWDIEFNDNHALLVPHTKTAGEARHFALHTKVTLASGRTTLTITPHNAITPATIHLSSGPFQCALTVALRGRIENTCHI